MQSLLYTKPRWWLIRSNLQYIDIHACKYRLVKRNPKNVFLKNIDLKGVTGLTRFHILHTSLIVLKVRWTINWLKCLFFQLNLSFSLQSTKEDCSCFYTVNRKDGLYGAISSRRLSIRKNNSKEFILKNRDLKSVSGFTASRILLTI